MSEQFVSDANGIGDVVDVQTTAAEPGCHVYLSVVVANWRQPWPTPTPTPTPSGSHGVSYDWGPEHRVNSTAGPATAAVGRTLAVDSHNVLHAVWTDISTGKYDAYYTRSTDGGQTWRNDYSWRRSSFQRIPGYNGSSPGYG